jgi:release factor glutamine methyltransferase
MSSNLDFRLTTWIKKATRVCSPQNPNAPSILAQKVLKLDKTEQLAKGDSLILTPKQARKLNNLLGRLLKGRPLSAVLKQTDFHNLKLKVNSRVLSPRAETEALINYAITNLPQNSKLVDLGTGSGAIGLAIYKARPDLSVTLTDISEHNLNLAKRNARFNRLENPTRLRYLKSNLIKKVDQTFLCDSFFVANLPYLNKNWAQLNHSRLKYEPSTALFAKQNGLTLIFNLLQDLKKDDLLNSNNWVLLEHDPSQFGDLTIFVKKLGYNLSQISPFVSLVKNT